MIYPDIVCGGHGEFTAEEIKDFTAFFTDVIRESFPDAAITSGYYPHDDHPYTTDVILFTVTFPEFISGRARADKARITARDLTLRVYKKTPCYRENGGQLPEKYFSVNISVGGYRIPYRKHYEEGFVWSEYKSYYHGDCLTDLDISSELSKIKKYISELV